MKTYNKPIIDLLKVDTTDIIQTSGLIFNPGEGDFTGGNTNFPE